MKKIDSIRKIVLQILLLFTNILTNITILPRDNKKQFLLKNS